MAGQLGFAALSANLQEPADMVLDRWASLRSAPTYKSGNPQRAM
jgi:hypothetical protein